MTKRLPEFEGDVDYSHMQQPYPPFDPDRPKTDGKRRCRTCLNKRDRERVR